MAEFTITLPAAASVSTLFADQEIGAATVMLPSWLPSEPVETVTFAVASALVSVVTFRTLSTPVAVKPETLLSGPVEMVRL